MAVGLALAAMAAAGASPLDSLPDGWPAAELLLLGEQHDAAEHQQLSAAVVRRLAAQGRLAAVAMEMAEQGRSTADLSREASEVQVREALGWDERGWPWPAYGPIVMAAVRAGVPVFGANLPRIDVQEKVTGAAIFTDDIQFGPGLRFARVKRSPYPHALVKAIHTEKAESRNTERVLKIFSVISDSSVPVF
jgi:uncharacterized iron-regulated protein